MLQTAMGPEAGFAAGAAAKSTEIEDVETLARLLDSRFSVLGIRFGYDAILGLLPGIGDAASLGLSSYIVAKAWRLGARKRTIAKMAANMVGDAVIGSIPLVGTIVDVSWKANRRNVALLRRELGLTDGRERARAMRPA